MKVASIRITKLAAIFLAAALAAALAGTMAACGASNADVRRARTSGYQTDFAIVYSQALAVVTKRYPKLQENAVAGKIQTAWHPIRIANSGSTSDRTSSGQSRDRNRSSANSQGNSFSQTNQARTRYFIRFDVTVTGGKPWRVNVHGQASRWNAGEVPVELKGADAPPWLRGRVDALYVAIYRGLKTHAIKLETRIVTKTKPAEEIDLSQYGTIPAAAAKRIAAIHRAARSRDFKVLRANMRDQFSWSFGGESDAEQAITLWQADAKVLSEMDKVLSLGCKADADGKRITCPPAYTAKPDYLSYRAGFELVAGKWLMTFFVTGD